ncbi:MAG: 1,4-alpha-glucan branching protein GlgB [Candidatus Thiodiazotropha sp.]
MYSKQIKALVRGEFSDPFSLLGPHRAKDGWVVRTFKPYAEEVALVDHDGEVIAAMQRIHDAGFFEAKVPNSLAQYRLRLRLGSGETQIEEDPYRYDSPLGDVDRYLLGEGSHLGLSETLGANLTDMEGVAGVHFAVWAPNARRVSVVGPFNAWDGRCHPMRLHPGNGVWDIFIPEIGSGELYKLEILDSNRQVLPLKADPVARRMEPPPGNASMVYASNYEWKDTEWMLHRSEDAILNRPMSIYEVHLGSWRRRTEEFNRWLNYRELADELVEYVLQMGFTHIELLPITEHPYDGSWGYQPIGLFAPTWRFGPPDDFKYFVDQCHQNGIGVILDWVPAHFPKDAHGLVRFDGTCLYEHADPRKGEHQDWGTLIYNFGRREVVNYLVANALWWTNEYHVDGLRVDAVASMLYLDYSRKPGHWVPNEYGGNENLEAIAFLKRLNELVHAAGAVVIAEESTSWPMVSRPTWLGGLGFTLKWNMGWMHDTLGYLSEDPVHRKYHHERMTFGLLYAFTENFVLPLSHDEVVHGKGSLFGRMSGDAWQRYANLRAYYAFMYGYPGKKLIFMGGEFAQMAEWNFEQSLDWHLVENDSNAGIQRLVRDLNERYRDIPALHERDCDAEGFQWIDCTDLDQGVLAFVRRARDPSDFVVVVAHFTPMVRTGYRIGVPIGGLYREILNTDAMGYNGSGVGNLGAVTAEAIEAHGLPYSLVLTLPPLATLMLHSRDRN